MTAVVAKFNLNGGLEKPLPPSPPITFDSIDHPIEDSVLLPRFESAPRRISRLAPINVAPNASAGPSTNQRYLYVAVRSGRRPGVYTEWREAEAQLLSHHDPVFKTFSTKMAAEAYVNGWNGAGRHSVPGSCPRPLREHLAMNFPSSVPLSSPSKRPSYHTRLVASAPSLSELPGTNELPASEHLKTSFRRSQVRISSPLRQQVDEAGIVTLSEKKAGWVMGAGGLLSPPPSPQDARVALSVVDRERPTARKSSTEAGLWSSTPRRDFGKSASVPRPSAPSPPSTARQSGLWVDTVPVSSSLSGDIDEPDLASNAPKFSRSAMRKSGVVMPAAAPRSGSTSSLRSRLSRNTSSTSISSLASSSSTQSSLTLRRPALSPKNSQDRLSSLAETSELQLGDGLLSVNHLAPPRPAFMRRSTSSSSVSSDASGRSMSSMTSLTSASSAITSSLESCSPIQEEPYPHVHGQSRDTLPPSCTKSDGDAASQMDGKTKEKKGGLFKRFSRVLKIEKKVTPGEDSSRRGSM